MPPLKVRYSRGLSVTSIIVGGLLAVIGLATKNWLSAGAGVVLFLLGVLQLRGSLVALDDGEVQVRNPLGMVLRRYPVTSPADLRFEGKTLTHVPTGKKITSLGFGMNKDDIAAFRAWVSSPPQQGQVPPQGQQQWPPPPQQGQVPPQGQQQWPPPPPQGQVPPQGQQQWPPPPPQGS